MEEKTTYPLAVALEKAGYQILSFRMAVHPLFDPERGKSVPTGVAQIEVIPNKDAKMLFIDSQEG